MLAIGAVPLVQAYANNSRPAAFDPTWVRSVLNALDAALVHGICLECQAKQLSDWLFANNRDEPALKAAQFLPAALRYDWLKEIPPSLKVARVRKILATFAIAPTQRPQALSEAKALYPLFFSWDKLLKELARY